MSADETRLGRDAVADVDDTIAEPALVEELKVRARVTWERRLAGADEYGTDEQLTLIDEPRTESVRGEVRASHREIFGRGRLQATDGVGVEVALELRLGGRHLSQGRGIDNLVRSLPDAGELVPQARLRGQGGVGLPDGHRFVHTAAVEICAGGAHEISDEREELVVGRGPVEVTVRVLDVAVERDVRDVNQLGHAAGPIRPKSPCD